MQLEALRENLVRVRIDREVDGTVSDGVIALDKFTNGVDRIEENDCKAESKESREHDDAEKLSGSHISHAFTIHATTN